MWNWLKTHNDPISALASILTVVVAVGGFWATWDQISKTKKALQAGNTYQIQKDGRELINSINAEGGLFLYLEGDGSEKTIKKAKVDIWNMNNFYLSVYRQSQANGLSKEFVMQYKKDFCSFANNSKIQSLIDGLQKRNAIGQRFEAMKSDWCDAK